eukprot:TRINITY_DN17372_c0_g1_i2.p1 TRINITY_DN17372_c0_g1~~TRINITY_DN17372_c0_g1_i2.p1  ORF type:complete len:100 (+),score=5.27 TRINITY_DN17372_c0_g1_i2:193-492(+)
MCIRDRQLSDNQLESLPGCFGILQAGGHIIMLVMQQAQKPAGLLQKPSSARRPEVVNTLESLPDSFIGLNADGNLHLSRNKLESLPECFGNLVGGNLYS